ncbi:hypothetical protein ACS0TY_018335 [Phlomoides rotata]
MWTTHSSFTPMVTASWAQFVTSNSPIHLVTQKLKRLKATWRNWNKDTFRNIYVEMEEASEALDAIQAETALSGTLMTSSQRRLIAPSILKPF